MKISVCMATYNGEKYIEKQLKSILNQTVDVSEIIISDNLSTDRTIEIIGKLNDKRIKFYSFEKRKRVALNFENALKHSNGDIIFLADQDDIWNKNKIKKCLEELEKYDMVVHNAKLKNKTFFKINGIRDHFLGNIYKSSFLGCCMVFKKEILTKALPFPDGFDTEKKPWMHGHDTWLGLIALKKWKVKFLKTPLIYYRRHENNVSESSQKSKRTLGEKIMWRIFLIKELLKRDDYGF